VDAYLESVPAELARRRSLLADRLETVYVGGGTPTALGGRLAGLVAPLAALLEAGGELTVEANPDSVDAPLLEGLRRAGVTRLSLGVQSFSAELRRTLGRRVSDAQIGAALAAVRTAGLSSWSLDLIFGLPGQDWRTARGDLEQALAWRPPHLSLYDLTYTAPYERRLAAARGPAARPEAETFAEEHYSRAVGLLEEAGYRRYEVSNFALPGHESRHTQAYWRGRDYVGLGPSAVSTVGCERWTNPPEVAVYLAGAPPVRERLTAGIRAVERVMLGLRTAAGVGEAEAAPVLEAEAAQRLTAQGLLLRACGRLRLSPHGLDVSNAVLGALLRWPSDDPPS